MADARPALRRLETALRDLLDRMAGTDPRRGALNRLLVRLAGKIGGSATAVEVRAIEALVDDLDALPDAGSFKDIVAAASSAVEAVGDPPRG